MYIELSFDKLYKIIEQYYKKKRGVEKVTVENESEKQSHYSSWDDEWSIYTSYYLNVTLYTPIKILDEEIESYKEIKLRELDIVTIIKDVLSDKEYKIESGWFTNDGYTICLKEKKTKVKELEISI